MSRDRDVLVHQSAWDALPTAPIDRDRTSPDGNWRITLKDGTSFVFETHQEHDFKPWRYGPLGRQRTCKTCDYVEHA